MGTAADMIRVREAFEAAGYRVTVDAAQTTESVYFYAWIGDRAVAYGRLSRHGVRIKSGVRRGIASLYNYTGIDATTLRRWISLANKAAAAAV